MWDKVLDARPHHNHQFGALHTGLFAAQQAKSGFFVAINFVVLDAGQQDGVAWFDADMRFDFAAGGLRQGDGAAADGGRAHAEQVRNLQRYIGIDGAIGNVAGYFQRNTRFNLAGFN